MNRPIKIYKESYVGIRKSGKGFLTPEGNNKSTLKWKEKIEEWVTQSYGGKKRTGGKYITFKNEFKNGYTIKGYNIKDPNGFEIKISFTNFNYIVENCTIDKGVLIGEFIWGKKGQSNLLIPKDSSWHKESLKDVNK